MGLLDFLNSDNGRMGMGLLAAAAPRTDGANFGQRLQEGMGSFDSYKKQKMAAQFQEMQMQEVQQKMAQQKQLREMAARFSIPAKPASAGGLQASDTSALPAELQTGVQVGPMGAQPASFDRAGFGKAWEAIDPIGGFAYQQSVQKDNTPITVAPGASLLDKHTFKPIFTAPKEQATPADQQGYALAQTQGYRGTYMDYQTALKRAGASTVSLPNYGTQEKEQSKEYGAGLGKMRVEMKNAGFKAHSTLANVDRMEALLQGVDGGKFGPLGMDIASAASSFGIKMDPNLGNKQASEALAVEMALAAKPAGSGAMSDPEYDNYLSTVPSQAKSPEGRRQISATIRAKAKRDIEISKQATAYAKANGGVIDDGFFESVAEYMAANPLIAQKQDKSLSTILNKYPPRR
jgi:hypothetical protein